MAQLYFKYGAMGSSKTANALMTRFNYEERAAYGMVLRNVQNMARNSTEEEITGYLLNQLEAGNINEEGIDTILQALNLAG